MNSFTLIFIILYVNVVTNFPVGVVQPNTTYYDPEKCGISLRSIRRNTRQVHMPYYHTKVMGGTNVEYGEHPWAVVLLQGTTYFCTGTLISKKHVITAAHCFFKQGSNGTVGHCSVKQALTQEDVVERTQVWYGSNCILRRGIRCSISPAMKVMKIVRAQFGRYFHQNCVGSDIALLELESEIDENRANYICLSNRLVVPSSLRIIYAVGWGSNPILNEQYMNQLQKIDFYELMDPTICKKQWDIVPDDVICTAEIFNHNVCGGDSGGGIMTQLENGRWVLLGLVSFGTPCAKTLNNLAKTRAQTYTDVRLYGGDIDKFTGFMLPHRPVNF